MTKSRKILVFLILAVLLITSFVAGHRGVKGSSDFDTYYYAGKAVLENLPLYTISQHAVNLSKSPFVYPPFFAFFIAPFSMLPLYHAAVVWNIFSFLSFAGAILLIVQMTGAKLALDRKNLAWTLIFLALSVAVLIDNLTMGQVNCFVYFLVVLGIYCLQKSRDLLSGFWTGMATCVKLFPAIFLPYFLIQRKWKAAFGFFLALILCLGVLPAISVGISKSAELHKQWFRETIQAHATPKTLAFYSTQLNPSHQDLRATVFRWVIDWEFRERTGGPNGRAVIFRTPLRLSEAWAGHAGNAAIGIVAVLFLLALLKTCGKSGNQNFLYSISLILTTMVLISPKARSHFFVFLTFPWLVLVSQIAACAKNRLREKQFFLASALFYLGQSISYFKFLGFGAFSTLALWIYFAFKLAKGKSDQQ